MKRSKDSSNISKMKEAAWRDDKIPRLLIAATGSGCGKTTVTCGLLQSFLSRGVNVISFKCGPDYIDPMFHTEVLGLPSRNLDLFFTGEETARSLFCQAVQKELKTPRLAIVEGVMGYYDGLAAVSTEGSSYHTARTIECPVILLIDCKGKSASILAEIKGFLEYKEDSRIQGVLLNRISPMIYEDIKKRIEEEFPVKVYGYLPQMEDCGLESRHLGLVTAKEVGNLKEILEELSEQMEQTVDLDGLLRLAESAGYLQDHSDTIDQINALCTGLETEKVRIGIAQDQAFCFYYRDNLELLTALGAQLVPFRPTVDAHLPEDLHGFIFGGGYPELYLRELASNQSLLWEIKKSIWEGIPCIAECGGFMYLHEWIRDESGKRFPMVGVVEGESFPTGKLGRFGYIEMTANRKTLLCSEEETLRGHEFHYWDSTNNGDGCTAKKPLRQRQWDCIVTEAYEGKKREIAGEISERSTLFAGYPHIHLYSNPKAAWRFVETCRNHQSNSR